VDPAFPGTQASRKVAEMRAARAVTLAFQHASGVLGYDTTVLVGTSMSHHKRLWLQYGIAFFAV
jgi:hypothetical protein